LGERFGWLAVFGRQPNPAEMRRMLAVENIVFAYDSMNNAEDWVTWAKENPAADRLLKAAMKAANDGE
jgi:hypothetical protein